MTNLSISYKRAPSAALEEFLMPNGSQGPLLMLDNQVIADHKCSVHFRLTDEIHVYRGLTRVLTAKWLRRRHRLKIPADKRYAYTDQICEAGLCGEWDVLGAEFEETLHRYLATVKVKPRHTDNEGAVQTLWSGVRCPWTSFDREAVLNYESTSHREESKRFPAVHEACTELKKVSRRREFEKPSIGARRLDQLAVDNKGRLVLLELKDGSQHNGKMYYSPFQLLQYVWEWHCALDDVRTDVLELIRSRKRMRLTPESVPDLTRGIRASVCFGQATPTSKAEEYFETVLEIVNQFLPVGMDAIEVWRHDGSNPHRRH